MKLEEAKIENILDLSKTDFYFLFDDINYPWEVLPLIKQKFNSIVEKLDLKQYNRIKDTVYVHKSVTILKSVYLGKNIIIGRDADIRNSAFIRENAIIGNNAVLGNSCEIKNAILFDNAECPHFNYIGDSVIGYKGHLGAGVITSNLKSSRSEVVVHFEDAEYDTKLRKFGAIVGDYAEIGCNSVLNPGTIIGRNTQVYPLTSVRMAVSENSIVKDIHNVVKKHNI